jgi:hypothetical protein
MTKEGSCRSRMVVVVVVEREVQETGRKKVVVRG